MLPAASTETMGVFEPAGPVIYTKMKHVCVCVCVQHLDVSAKSDALYMGSFLPNPSDLTKLL